MSGTTSRPEDFAPVEPYRPPWYPHDDDPWRILSTMSDNRETGYSKWVASLPAGELRRLIREHRGRAA